MRDAFFGLLLVSLWVTIMLLVYGAQRGCEKPKQRWEQYIQIRSAYCWVIEEVEYE